MTAFARMSDFWDYTRRFTDYELQTDHRVDRRTFDLDRMHRLLDAIGLGLTLETEADSGAPVENKLEYRYVPEEGPMRNTSERARPRVHGDTLRALAQDAELSGRGLREAKQLMRYVLNHHLEGRKLSSRKFFEAHASGNS